MCFLRICGSNRPVNTIWRIYIQHNDNNIFNRIDIYYILSFWVNWNTRRNILLPEFSNTTVTFFNDMRNKDVGLLFRGMLLLLLVVFRGLPVVIIRTCVCVCVSTKPTSLCWFLFIFEFSAFLFVLGYLFIIIFF